jgi:hypothetical protein
MSSVHTPPDTKSIGRPSVYLQRKSKLAYELLLLPVERGQNPHPPRQRQLQRRVQRLVLG